MIQMNRTRFQKDKEKKFYEFFFATIQFLFSCYSFIIPTSRLGPCRSKKRKLHLESFRYLKHKQRRSVNQSQRFKYDFHCDEFLKACKTKLPEKTSCSSCRSI